MDLKLTYFRIKRLHSVDSERLNAQEAKTIETVLDKYFSPQKVQGEVQSQQNETAIGEEFAQGKKANKGTKGNLRPF